MSQEPALTQCRHPPSLRELPGEGGVRVLARGHEQEVRVQGHVGSWRSTDQKQRADTPTALSWGWHAACAHHHQNVCVVTGMVLLLRTHASLRPGRACPLQHKQARQRRAAELAVCKGEAGRVTGRLGPPCCPCPGCPGSRYVFNGMEELRSGDPSTIVTATLTAGVV